MEALRIVGTIETPTVSFNGDTGILEISGKSLPEDVKEFYLPVTTWLGKYMQTPQLQTVMKLKLLYFNTASSKILLDMLEMLNEMYAKGLDVMVEWHYPIDDEDLLYAGNDYSDMVQVPFKMISYQ